MSKWNNYAKKLDAAFREAQRAYEAEVAKLNAAQKARDDAFTYSTERPVGAAAYVLEAKKQAATAELRAAHEDFTRAARKIVYGYSDTVEKLKKELSDAVDAATMVDPAAVDSNALALLNSGIMNAADYKHMLEKFKDNSTMRRMIGKYAKDAAEARKDDKSECTALRIMSNEAGRDSYNVKETFNTLANASVRYMGISSPERAGFAQQMQAHWNDGDIQEAISVFGSDATPGSSSTPGSNAVPPVSIENAEPAPAE